MNDERLRYFYLFITPEAILSGYMLNDEAWEIAKTKKTPCHVRRFDTYSEMKEQMTKMSIKE